MRSDWAGFLTRSEGSMPASVWQEQAARFQNEVAEVQQSLEELRGKGIGPRRLVGVVVNVSGEIVSAVVSENHADYSHEDISNDLVAAHAVARENVRQEAERILGPLRKVQSDLRK